VDERVLLFLKMKKGARFSSQLVQNIKTAIGTKRSLRRHVPSYIFEIKDIPYTVNGKKCEISIKQVMCGRVPAVSGTVANPESIDLYKPYFHIEEELARQREKL
jgi:acetoacetyl-CoA synthetase